jgi:hypothetical protein
MMLLASDKQDAALAFARAKVVEAQETISSEENGKEFAVGMKLLLGQILSAVVSCSTLPTASFQDVLTEFCGVFWEERQQIAHTGLFSMFWATVRGVGGMLL